MRGLHRPIRRSVRDTSTTESGCTMSAGDKIQNAAEKLAGKAKEAVGNATNDHDTAQEGRNDQSKASAKQAGENIKDVFK